MKRTPFHVTDHAVVRYLERVHGVDVEALRAEIAVQVASVDAMPDGMPEPAGVVVDGFVFRLAGRTIVTVAPASEPNKRTHRGRK